MIGGKTVDGYLLINGLLVFDGLKPRLKMLDDYQIFDPKVDRPLHELSRRDAMGAYEWFMSQKEDRKTMLIRHASRKGVFLNKAITENLEDLHHFFVGEVQKDGIKQRPSSYIFSLCNDIGIYISELVISACPHLSWGLNTFGKKGISYHRPVVLGFSSKSKKDGLDMDFLLCQYACRLCKGGPIEDIYFWRIYDAAIT